MAVVGRSRQHSWLPKRKVHGLSRQSGTRPYADIDQRRFYTIWAKCHGSRLALPHCGSFVDMTTGGDDVQACCYRRVIRCDQCP